MSDARHTSDAGLTEHVIHELEAPRVQRQWATVSRRLAARRRGRRVASYGAVVLVGIALGLVLRRPAMVPRTGAGSPGEAPVATSWEGAMFDSQSGETLVLADGAEVRLGAATRLRVGTWNGARATFALERGDVTLDVPHVEGRAWIVTAGAFDVRVVGTRFHVRREPGPDGDRVSVDVERGRVEVINRNTPDDVRALGAGESWHQEPLASAAPTDPDAAGASTDAGSNAEADGAAPAPSGASSHAAPTPSAPSWEEYAKQRQYRKAYDALGAEGFTRIVDAASPERVLRAAEVARAAGHPRDAERGYDALRRRYRGDPRAGLAAFELGRLRLDTLGNPAGAAEAFADAIALAPNAPFREDAEARRVQALSASGAKAACVSARDAYLARYPDGAHAASVRSTCGGR